LSYVGIFNVFETAGLCPSGYSIFYHISERLSNLHAQRIEHGENNKMRLVFSIQPSKLITYNL